MLRMAPFEVHLPTSATDAVALRMSLPGAQYVAGGTDLLPNLKHRLAAPQHLVSLQRAGLGGISVTEGALRIGAGTTLHAVATSPVVQQSAPALASAASVVAGPQHRRMGTLGGNVLLDTRCLFYNQSEPWREALGYCLKKDGTWCHVIDSERRCVAAQSSDTVPVLVAMDAVLELQTPTGPAERAVRDLFRQDGRVGMNHAVPEGSLLCAVRVPAPGAGHRGVYRKVRARGAVDFPQLGVAAVGTFDGATCTSLDIVLGALMPQPRRLRGTEVAIGTPLPDATVAALAEEAFRQAHPQGTVHGDPAWRKHMARVETRRALEHLRS